MSVPIANIPIANTAIGALAFPIESGVSGCPGAGASVLLDMVCCISPSACVVTQMVAVSADSPLSLG
jgi:hypothetical protein